MLAFTTLDLWENTEKYLGYDAYSPDIFCAIIKNQQQVNYSTVCALVRALQKTSLTDKPGKEVETLATR